MHPNANPASRVKQLKRFQQNPEKNWGPKSRSTAGSFKDDSKRIRNQGKKRKNGGDDKAEDSNDSDPNKKQKELQAIENSTT
jgi:hypothetical protein